MWQGAWWAWFLGFRRSACLAVCWMPKEERLHWKKWSTGATNHEGKKHSKDWETENRRRRSGNILTGTEILIGRISVHYRLCPWNTLALRFQWVLKSLPNGPNLNKHPPFPFHTEMKLLCCVQLRKTWGCWFLLSQRGCESFFSFSLPLCFSNLEGSLLKKFLSST